MSRVRKIKDFLMRYSLITVMCLIIIIPILILFIASFKSNMEFASTAVFELPESFDISNYISVFERGNFGIAFLNTFIILIFSILINIITGSMLAYALGRFEFKGKNIIILLIMAARVIPTITTQVAVFTVIRDLGLFNTLLAPIILYAGTDVVQIFLYLQFVNSIPYDLDESAKIEGASYFKIYRSLIFPLLKPVTVTTAILKTVTIYNDMYIPYLYLPSTQKSVVSTAIMKFCGSAYGAQVPVMAAAFIVAMIPMLLIYILAQRLIFAGLTSGAVKA